jgi:Tfp pilus assembly protein PilX
MRNNRGIAIVASIIVMVVILALGVGSMFLTQNNLKTAENVRSNAVAKSNAESGLDVAYELLRDYYATNKKLPEQPVTFSDDTYAVSYFPYNEEEGRMQSVGTSSSGAEFISEAIFSVAAGKSSIPPELIKGLTSEGEVRVNGGASLYVDAGVHGNSGFWLGGDFRVCEERDALGLCTEFDPATIADADLPVSLSNPNGSCRVRSTTCNANNYLEPAISIGVNYLSRRNRAADLNGDGNFNPDNYRSSLDCATALTGTTGNAMTGRKICASGAVTLQNADLTDVTIITNGNITLNGTSTLNNVTLISLNGTVIMGTSDNTNVRIFSQNAMTFSGSNKSPLSWTWNGENTIATASNITINGSGRHDNIINPIINEDGSVNIGLAIIAEGNITFNGSNDERDYYTAFVSGGTFTQNGRSRFFGSIASRGTLRFNGNLEIDSGLDYTNRDLLSNPDKYLAATSRR